MEVQNRKSILLVEDQAILAMHSKLIIEKKGYRVTVANNAERAIEAARTEKPDLILMDIDLGNGVMDGTEAAEIILKDHDLPIVFLTGHSEQEYVQRVKGITCYGYVVKNSGEFVLMEAISMAFELFQREKAVIERNKALKILLEVSRINLEKQNYRDTLQKTTDAIVQLLNFESSALYLLKDEESIELTATTPPLQPDVPDYYLHAYIKNHPHIKRCIETATPVSIYDVEEEIMTKEEMDIAEGRSLRSFLYLPLVYENKVIGVLITGNREPIRLPEHIIESCVSLVNISSLTISNARLFQDTRQKLLDLQK
jgi:CheY-like chemotaxis protein